MRRTAYRDCCDTDTLLPNPKVPCCYIYDRPASVRFTASYYNYPIGCIPGGTPPCSSGVCATMPKPTSGVLTFNAGSECAPLYTSTGAPFYFAFTDALAYPPATGSCLTMGTSSGSVSPNSSVCNPPNSDGSSGGFTASFTIFFTTCNSGACICAADITITSP